MASISKISVQVAANAKQFDSTFNSLEEKLRNFGKAVSDAKIADGFNRLSEIGKKALDEIEFDKQAKAGAFAIIAAVDSVETRLVAFQAKAFEIFDSLPPLLGGRARPKMIGDGIPDAEYVVKEYQKLLGAGGKEPPKPPSIGSSMPDKDFLETMNKYPQTWRRHFDGLGKAIKSALSELYNGTKIGLKFGYKLTDGIVQGVSGGLRRLYDSIFNIRNLVLGLVFGAMAYFIRGIIESNIETLEFSKRIGTAASEVSALDFAIMQTGHPIESMREGLQDLSLQLAKLSRGDIVVADMFNQIGLTAEQLRNKNPAEVFTMIAHRIRQIEDPARQAGAAVRIFGKEAIHLLPLLQSGAVGIGKAMEKAKNLGLLVDNEKLEKLKEGSIALSNIRKALDGIVLQLATNLAPIFGTLIQLLDKWIGKFNFEDMFSGLGDVVVNVITFFVQLWNGANIAFINIRIAFIKMVGEIAFQVKTLEWALANSSIFGSKKERDRLIAERPEFDQAKIKRAMDISDLEQLRAEFENDPMNVAGNVKKWFDLAAIALRVGRVAFAKENKALNQANINEKFFEQAGKMAEQTLQPLEVFQQKIRDIQELMEKTGESKFLKRSQLEAMNQLASSLGADQSRLAGADLRGTAGAVSAFNQSRYEREVKSETPAKRLERLQKEGTASLKNIEKYSEETSKALKDIKQVAIP